MSKPPHSQRGPRQEQVTQQPRVEVQQWTGPLPPPAALAKFNEIIPNGADRVMAMAEKEHAHRIAYEAAGLQATTREATRGQYLGAAVSIIAVCGAVYAAHVGAHWSVAVALVGIPVLGMIRAIVRPRPKQSH